MISDLHISRIGREHSPAAFDLLRRFFTEEGFATPLDQVRDSLDVMIGHPATAVFLAWQTGAPVAVATVSYTPSLEHGLYAELEDLYVLPEARGRGLARSLVEACCEWCRARGCSSLEVCVTPEAEVAHRLTQFYDRLGFTNTDRSLLSRSLT